MIEIWIREVGGSHVILVPPIDILLDQLRIILRAYTLDFVGRIKFNCVLFFLLLFVVFIFFSLTLDAIRTAFGLLSEIRLRHWRLVQVILYYQNVALSFIIQRLLGLSVPLSSFRSTRSPSFLNFNLLMGKDFLARLLTLLIFLRVDWRATCFGMLADIRLNDLDGDIILLFITLNLMVLLIRIDLVWTTWRTLWTDSLSLLMLGVPGDADYTLRLILVVLDHTAYGRATDNLRRTNNLMVLLMRMTYPLWMERHLTHDHLVSSFDLERFSEIWLLLYHI